MKKFYTLVIFLISLFYSSFYYGNYMLIQNVAMTSENTGAKTVQVQFDISWENSWLDEVNFDAAWVFVKYKDTSGDWHHATINTDGYSNGSGTLNQIDVTEDKVGAFFRRNNILGSGNFDADDVQLQWAYGSDGLSDINGIEIRVFAIEMVYVPEGDFNCSPRILQYYGNITLHAPGNNAAVINSRLSPVLTYNGDSLRIKGNAGIDTDNDGVVDNTTFPTGYFPFYCFKYELTEQQYADFLNTLSPSQIANLGIAGTNISLINDAYVSTIPNKVCKGANENRFYAYADWCGLRPMTYLEHNKACYGPEYLYNNNNNQDNNPWNSSYAGSISVSPSPQNGEEVTSYISRNRPSSHAYFYRAGLFAANVNASSGSNARQYSGGSYYGIMDMWGNRHPLMWWPFGTFSNVNGNGVLSSSGYTDEDSWSDVDSLAYYYGSYSYTTFRYVRSAPDLIAYCTPIQNLNIETFSFDTIVSNGWATSFGDPNFYSNPLLSWDAGGSESEWLVEYGPEGFAFGSGASATVNETSYTLPIEISDAIYDIYVKPVCDQQSSNWRQIQLNPCEEFVFTIIIDESVDLSLLGGYAIDVEYDTPYETSEFFTHTASIYEESMIIDAQENDVFTINYTYHNNWSSNFSLDDCSWKVHNNKGVEIASGDFNDLPKSINLTCE